jgi:8-oxo-dGTP pyrophosphatase MutT (NUDIX family)
MVAKGLNERTSAAKEALEEAGILGKVSKNRIGRFRYEKWGGVCRVTVFLMEVHTVLDRWPEKDRKRKWVGIIKAQKLVDEKSLGKLISKVPHVVSSETMRLKRVHGYG